MVTTRKLFVVAALTVIHVLASVSASNKTDENPEERWNYKKMIDEGAKPYDPDYDNPLGSSEDNEINVIYIDKPDQNKIDNSNEENKLKSAKTSGGGGLGLKELLFPKDNGEEGDEFREQRDEGYIPERYPYRYPLEVYDPRPACRGCDCLKRGETGDYGDVGERGYPGEPGKAGSNGDPGEDGLKGQQGDTDTRIGLPGRPGDLGYPGPAGYPGSSGPPGPPGRTSGRGPPGLPGMKGKHGTKGIKGEPGRSSYLAGPTGDPGLPGDRGFDGTDGVPGDPGLPGDRGLKGKDGCDGPPGTDGRPGQPGRRGYGGTKGRPGRPGTPGPQGYSGPPGRKGYDGPPGPGTYAKGERGDPGNPGFSGGSVQGRIGPRGRKGDPGIGGPTGRPGGPGSSGPKGEEGDSGYSLKGAKGDRGFPGRTLGPKGYPGIAVSPLLKAFRGPKGLPGDPGTPRPGRAGPPGDPGPRGSPGEGGYRGPPGSSGGPGPEGRPGSGVSGPPGPKGESGIPGYGYRGPPGPPGPIGDKGRPGFPGTYGYPGRKGSPGPFGPEGFPGTSGPPGYSGDQGRPGGPGTPGSPGNTVVLYAIHSQTERFPNCPRGHPELWKGYSLLHTEDEGRAHVQDLGQAGSCLQKFSPMPFMMCDKNGICAHARRTATTYYLSTEKEAPMMPVKGYQEIMPYLSRCIVCLSRKPVVAVHSQEIEPPACPLGFTELWEGYSFVMHAIGEFGGGQPLNSPGSCLQNFRHTPYIECNGQGECHYFQDKFSYWMVNIYSRETSGKVVKAHETLNHIGRCKVCVYVRGGIEGF